MHEMALCEAVLAVAFEAADGRPITRVKVRVGELQRVLPESWEMCWRMAAMDSSAADSMSELSDAPARIQCLSCGEVGAPRPPLDCAACGGHSVKLLEGDDLVVEEIELEDGTVLRNPGLVPVGEESS